MSGQVVSRPLVALAVALCIGACGRGGWRVEESRIPEMGPSSADPALAVDPATGDVLMTWVAGGEKEGWRIWFARSTNQGREWSTPVAVSDTGLVEPHGEAAPRLVAATGGRVAVLWSTSFAVEGRQWPATLLRLARSSDGGVTWSPAQVINDDTASAPISHTFQGLAWAGDSGLVAAWLDERGGPMRHDHANHDSTAGQDATIYTVASNDFGRSWQANRAVWTGVCPCCRVTLARKPDGGTEAAWRRHYPGEIRDVVVSDFGAEGSEPMRVNEDRWVYPGCPHSGPAITVTASGRTDVVWYTGSAAGNGVFLARREAGGTFAAPIPLLTRKHVPVAHAAVTTLASGGTVAAWDRDPRAEAGITVSLVPSGDNHPHTLAVLRGDAPRYPQLAAVGPAAVVVGWTEGSGHAMRVRLARVALEEKP